MPAIDGFLNLTVLPQPLGNCPALLYLLHPSRLFQRGTVITQHLLNTIDQALPPPHTKTTSCLAMPIGSAHVMVVANKQRNVA